MTQLPNDEFEETARQRTRDQIALIRAAHDDAIIVDTDDDADFNFMCSSDELLVDPADRDLVESYFNQRTATDSDLLIGSLELLSEDNGLGRYRSPGRRDAVPGDRSLLTTLDELDRDRRPGLASPNHLVHICKKPVGSQCPATEPMETGVPGPWPSVNTDDPDAGRGVRVVVIDGGWYHPLVARGPVMAPAPDRPWPWLEGVTGQFDPAKVYVPAPAGLAATGTHEVIRKYAGHGTFIAGVVRAMAPKCSLHVMNLHLKPLDPDGEPDAEEPVGLDAGQFETEVVRQLDAALALDVPPQLINLSAGCTTRQNRPSLAFQSWWQRISADPRWADLVVVAAAGNNASPQPFWPASFDWAVGVGSVDRDGRISDFSNHGDSVDVFAPGRNVVNAFPDGTYICDESPNAGDVRVFDRGLARWSGTSFSAPLVTGLIAAAMSGQGLGARAARDAVLGIDPIGTSVEVPRYRRRQVVPVIAAPD